MSEFIAISLLVINLGLTLINLAVLGIGVKLYTDQTKQAILRGQK